ncbi:hypothetical protein ACFQE5_22315 [Pseudonocardia hispaniensis]|uniref:RecA/RadA family phage recombinase n=1 Tax=Pseudonocardia hispaniensis TaxID=904933 RepID=A0ABW1J8L0_9PSEU
MATLAIQSIVNTGVNPALVAASAGGDKVAPGAGVFLEVANGGAAPITVTLVTPQTVDGDLAVADRAVSVPNGESRLIAVPASLYRNPSDGLASITYSDTTSVTVGAFRASVAG